MELRHLRYFVAVAELESFTRASRRLRVAQPALSRQIQDLEQELRVSLLTRGPRGAILTPAGKAFLPEARGVLRKADEAMQAAQAFALGDQGELQVGFAPSPTVELLPRILHAFTSEAGAVRLRLHDLSTEGLLRGLREGGLQAALMVRPSARHLHGLVFEGLIRYPVCVAVHPGHRLAKARRYEMQELPSEALFSFSRSEYPEYDEWLRALFKPLGRPPRIVGEHDGATSLIAAVEAGQGAALVPSCFSCVTGGRVGLLELQPAPEPFTVGVAYDRRQLCPVSRRFLSLLRRLPDANALSATRN